MVKVEVKLEGFSHSLLIVFVKLTCLLLAKLSSFYTSCDHKNMTQGYSEWESTCHFNYVGKCSLNLVEVIKISQIKKHWSQDRGEGNKAGNISSSTVSICREALCIWLHIHLEMADRECLGLHRLYFPHVCGTKATGSSSLLPCKQL